MVNEKQSFKNESIVTDQVIWKKQNSYHMEIFPVTSTYYTILKFIQKYKLHLTKGIISSILSRELTMNVNLKISLFNKSTSKFKDS